MILFITIISPRYIGNSVDPESLASLETSRSRSTVFSLNICTDQQDKAPPWNGQEKILKVLNMLDDTSLILIFDVNLDK